MHILTRTFATMSNNSIANLEWRYATKKFDPSKILDKEQLNILKNAFNLTATSYGLQTIYLGIIEDKIKREKLVELAYGQRQVLDSSHLLVIAYQEKITDNDVDALFNNIHETRETPETILAPYRKDLKIVMAKKTLEQQQEWSIRQAYIALGNLMTVCANERIDCCPMEGFVRDKFDEVLGLDKKNLKSVLLLPVGSRAKDDMFADFKKVRKDVSDSIISL